MNISVRACVGERESKKRRWVYLFVRGWERESKRGDEYICACVLERERANEEMNISVRACVGERESK